MRYAQKQAKRAFLDNMTTVLPLSGRVGLPSGDRFGIIGIILRSFEGAQTTRMAGLAHNFGSYHPYLLGVKFMSVMKKDDSSCKAIFRLMWALFACWGLSTTDLHAAEKRCSYVKIEPSMDVEINTNPPYCIFSRPDRLGYYWLLVMPIEITQSQFLKENIWTPRPPVKEGQWNEVSCGYYYPAEDFLILASAADDWFDRDTRVKILERHRCPRTRLKPFAIPNDHVWKQVQEQSPGCKFDILASEPDCTALELEGRKFIGSTFGDFNGDGRPDVVFNTMDPSGRPTLWIFHARDDDEFDLVVRRQNFSAWVMAFRKEHQKKDTLVFAGGCEKGDSIYLEYDTKTGKYMEHHYPYEENSAVPFESGTEPDSK